MRKTIYLHVGTHKTGTTAVQVSSVANVDSLEENDVLYPKVGRPAIRSIGMGHHLLAWNIIGHPVSDNYYGDTSRDSMFTELREEINQSKCSKVLISSEEFDRFTSENIVRLCEELAEFDIVVIAYLRRKDSYIEAAYQTMVMHDKGKFTIQEFVDTMDIPLNYYDFITKWKGVVGDKNVIVGLYDRQHLLGGDVVLDLYGKLDLSLNIEKPSKSEKVNSTIPLQYVAVSAMLSRLGDDVAVDRLKRIAKKVGSLSSKDFHLLPLEQRIEFAESGRQELIMLGIDLEGDIFTLTQSEKEKHVSGEDSKFAGLRQVIRDIDAHCSE